jgi:hypothetical protein
LVVRGGGIVYEVDFVVSLGEMLVDVVAVRRGVVHSGGRCTADRGASRMNVGMLKKSRRSVVEVLRVRIRKGLMVLDS